MEYKTITFDANQPAVQSITEPLDSEYGIAVKVKKDGEYLDAAMTVDGKAAEELVDGWKTVELSSGNTPTTKYLPVEASKAPSMSASVSATLEHTTPMPADMQFTMNATVTGISENLRIESPAWLARPEVRMVFTSQDGSTTERGLTGADQFYITNARGVTTAEWNASTGKWELSPTIDVIYPSSKMQLKVMMPANSTVEAEAAVKVDSGDGFASEFSLVVQEQDLGYIEF